MENSNVNINFPQMQEGNKVSVFKSLFNYILELKWTNIFKVYLVIFSFLATGLAFYYAYSVVSDKEMLNKATSSLFNEETNENVRDNVVTPKIQHELRILIYTINADRGFIFELHNGKKNTSGLPFRFADMSYEESNEERNVDRVALQFQDIPLTLYKYPHYLQKQKVMIGTVEDIEKVDPEYAKHIRSIGGKYLGMVYMSSNGHPIGFLCVSYHNLNDVPSKKLIEEKLIEYSKMISSLLDLNNHVKK